MIEKHPPIPHDSFLLKGLYHVLRIIITMTMDSCYRLFGIKKSEVRLKHAETYLVSTSLFFIVLCLGAQWSVWVGWLGVVLGNIRILQIMSLNLMTILFDASHLKEKNPHEIRSRWHLIALGFSFVDIVLIFSLFYQVFNRHFNILNQANTPLLDCIYYSVMTMTTIGFGDIHPINTLGRILSIYQAITAIFFLIFAVAGAISRLNIRNSDTPHHH